MNGNLPVKGWDKNSQSFKNAYWDGAKPKKKKCKSSIDNKESSQATLDAHAESFKAGRDLASAIREDKISKPIGEYLSYADYAKKNHISLKSPIGKKLYSLAKSEGQFTTSLITMKSKYTQRIADINQRIDSLSLLPSSSYCLFTFDVDDLIKIRSAMKDAEKNK